jgi:hypothetical protein
MLPVLSQHIPPFIAGVMKTTKNEISCGLSA